VLLRPKFSFPKQSVHPFLADFTQKAIKVRPSQKVSIALEEPDNRFLECAYEAHASYLVTGNKKHFPFPTFKGTKIVSPIEFAQVLVS
jgi:uncharacterized protein